MEVSAVAGVLGARLSEKIDLCRTCGGKFLDWLAARKEMSIVQS
jgi:hypothetical protein